MIGVAIVVVTAAGCDTLQRALIYPARHYDHVEFEKRVRERFAGGAAVLAPFDAIVLEPSTPAVATAIWFHGNGNVNTDFVGLAPVFAERKVRLVLAEYPGYGARAGTPSEHVLVEDAHALYDAVVKGFPREPIVVIGQSLGSGVAVQVAVDPTVRPPDRLVLATPFFNLPDAASRAFWNLPLQWIVSDRYDSGSALTRYFGSLVVVVAARDRFVGAESGRRLAKVARAHGTTTLIELPEADHNDWLSSMSKSNWDAVLGGISR